MSHLALWLKFVRKKPLHQLLFYLLLFLLPTQLGKHFWFDFSLVLGVRIDYLAPTIYLTDILILAILFFYLFDRKSRSLVSKSVLLNSFTLLLLLLLAVVNTFSAISPPITIYQWLRVFESFFLAWYVAKNISYDRSFNIILAITVIYSAALAILQFTSQHSIGGILYFLGERAFSAATPGIATSPLWGNLVLRPYATFPHPNVLAGYIVAIIPFIAIRPRRWLSFSALVTGLLALMISLSRSAWVIAVLGFGALVFWHLKKNKIYQHVTILALLGLLVFFLPLIIDRFGALGSLDKESYLIREDLMQGALQIIREHPVIGAGLGNFITTRSDLDLRGKTIAHLQPVHNIYLLLAAEVGLIGLLIFLLFIFTTIRRLLFIGRLDKPKVFAIILSLTSLLLLGLTDHYVVTIQQTRLLFAIIVGLAWGL